MISLIVAMDEAGVIGKDNKMPWHLPADLKYFKRTTLGHPVLMGRKTYESIGRPLPERRNIVLTRQEEYAAPGCDVIHSVEEIALHEGEDLFVIGGAEIFQMLLPKTDRLYLTRIHERFAGDTYFPSLDLSEWTLLSETKGTVDEKNPHPHTFLVYEKRS